jgi:hypothetical protein
MRKKFFKNDIAVGMSGVLLGLLAYIFFTSLIISFLVVNIYGINYDTPNLPTSKDVKIYDSNQDFKNGSYDLSTIVHSISSNWEYIENIGLRLKGQGGYLVINNIQPDSEGFYSNTYWINNSAINILSAHGDYCIVIRYTGVTNQNEVCVKSDGFHIYNYFLNAGIIAGDKYFYAYPDANQVELVSIKTIYNENTPSLDFYFNGDKIFVTDQLNTGGSLFEWGGRYYGGVWSNTRGFILEQFTSDNQIISLPKNTAYDQIALLAVLFDTMLKISLYQVPSFILPAQLIVVFISFPEALFILALAIVIIRGVD